MAKVVYSKQPMWMCCRDGQDAPPRLGNHSLVFGRRTSSKTGLPSWPGHAGLRVISGCAPNVHGAMFNGAGRYDDPGWASLCGSFDVGSIYSDRNATMPPALLAATIGSWRR